MPARAFPDRRIGEHFRIGAGCNFSDFSDELTELDHGHEGWFLNLAGYSESGAGGVEVHVPGRMAAAGG